MVPALIAAFITWVTPLPSGAPETEDPIDHNASASDFRSIRPLDPAVKEIEGVEGGLDALDLTVRSED
jgi:hypothetical protein